MLRRLALVTSTAVLALAVLVVGHNLVFLAAYGPSYEAALIATGHGDRWNETVREICVAAGFLAVIATLRLVFLLSLTRSSSRGESRVGPSILAYGRILAPFWMRVFAVSICLYVVQENYERWASGIPLPGLGVLGSSELTGPVPVFLLVSFLVAAVAALFGLGIATLEAQIEPRRQLVWRAVPGLRPAYAGHRRPATSVLGRNLAGRAPPALLPL
jgi:hypothetical protein